MKKFTDFKLKHGHTTIPVKVVADATLMVLGKGILSEGQYLFGMHRCWPPTIYINQERGNKFSTLIHEVGEYINSEYSMGMTHEELSLFTKAMGDILIENKKVFKKLL